MRVHELIALLEREAPEAEVEIVSAVRFDGFKHEIQTCPYKATSVGAEVTIWARDYFYDEAK